MELLFVSELLGCFVNAQLSLVHQLWGSKTSILRTPFDLKSGNLVNELLYVSEPKVFLLDSLVVRLPWLYASSVQNIKKHVSELLGCFVDAQLSLVQQLWGSKTSISRTSCDLKRSRIKNTTIVIRIAPVSTTSHTWSARNLVARGSPVCKFR